MSDSPQGPGWWQASDGKWYPPEAAPGGSPTPAGGGVPGTLDVGAALSYGWNKFVQYIGQIIVVVVIIVAVNIVFNFASNLFFGRGLIGFAIGFLIMAIGIVISFVLQAGIIRVGLAVVKGQTPEPSMLFSTERLGPFVIAAVLVGLLTFVGFLACCVGALVVMLFTLFWGYFVLDAGDEPVEAIKGSYTMVKDNLGSVLVFAIVVIALNLITCGLAIGVTQIATAYAYKTLRGEPVAP